MATFNEVLSRVKSEIEEIDAEGTKSRLDSDDSVVLVDVRERDEYEQGFIGGASWVPRGFLEMKIEDIAPTRDQEVIVYCAGGVYCAVRESCSAQ